MSAHFARAAGVLTLAAFSVSCATTRPLTGNQLRKAKIQIYRDYDDKCHTITTPFFKIKRSEKAKWDIEDETGCLAAAGAEVEIKFDKGDGDPLDASCSKKGKTKIECDVRGDADLKRYGYTVYIPDSKEDPEIQIEM